MKRCIIPAFLLGVVSVSPVRAADVFDSFDTMWEEMQQDMLTSMKHSRHLLKELHAMSSPAVGENKTPEILVSEDTDANTVSISIPVETACTTDFKIEVEDEIARVIIPAKDGEIRVVIDDRFISVSGSTHIEQKTKKDAGESIAQSASQFHIEQLLPSRVDINTVKAQCKDGTLLLTFSKKSTKRVIVVENDGKPAAKTKKNTISAAAEGMK